MMHYLAIDTGNTRTKLGLFTEAGRLVERNTCDTEEAPQMAASWAAAQGGVVVVGWLSTAKSWSPEAWEPLTELATAHIYQIHPGIKWPFPHRYQTPETLGADRFAGIVAACNLSPGKPVLVVDAGTAITYDVATSEPMYLGGAISPGIQMRYDALHHFTARLPRLSPNGKPPLIGDSTTESLRAGVEGAAIQEMNGMIQSYRAQVGDQLQVFLTGGDAESFEKQLKNINFADNSLVLRGIYFILKHIAST